MSVAALVDGVIVDVGVRFLEPELLDLFIAHIDEVEYLQLVRVQFDAKGYRDLHLRMLGETPHGIGLRVDDIMAEVGYLKAPEVLTDRLRMGQHGLGLRFVRHRPQWVVQLLM